MNDGISLIAAAFLGGVASYMFERLLRWQEHVATRSTLLNSLRTELDAIPEKPTSYRYAYLHVERIRLVTSQLVLDGRSIDYRTHGDFLGKVIALQIELHRYNDHAAAIAGIQAQWYGGQEPDPVVHRALYDSMAGHLAEVAKRKTGLVETVETLMRASDLGIRHVLPSVLIVESLAAIAICWGLLVPR